MAAIEEEFDSMQTFELGGSGFIANSKDYILML